MSFIKNPVQIITGKIETHDRRLSVDYPTVMGLKNPSVQARINRAILALVNQLIIDQGYYKDSQMTVQGWYEIKTNERDILSLTIGNYAITVPSAHGLTLLRSLTFNITSGKQYTLGELFKKDSNYVKVLSDMVQEQIQERDMPLVEVFKGISPDQYFYIADKALILYFQLYELTPYVYGFPFFPISVYAIQDIIKEYGPLGLMAIND